MHIVYQKEYSLNEIDNISNELILYLNESKIWCFEGEMGAGKTTLISSLCKKLGSDDTFSSPTYSIINEYDLEGKTLVHMDLFRLKNIEELLNIDFERYINSDDFCFIEWFQIATDYIYSFYKLSISKTNENKRFIQVTYH